MAKQRKIKSAAYHRNGVGGEGFYVALFTDPESGPMLGIHFPAEDGSIRTAVLNTDLLAKGTVEFSVNSWRGDNWHTFMSEDVPALVDAETTALIAKHTEEMRREKELASATA